ncbi:MAG: TetR/AcrR family transcriptional regulator [Clostridia bacterium]|nr:TetR/AcrR family transcriptional regulator [Clostridia bacterium]
MSSDLKKIEKKMKILDTAFSLFRDSSVNSTAIDDIVKAAGIARGTFYLYFKDKSDLLEQIILYKSTEYMKEILRETFLSESSSEADFFELIKKFLNCFIDFMIKNKEILPVMTKNISSCLKNIPEFYDAEIYSIYEKLIGNMISLGYTAEGAHMTAFIVIDMTGSVCSDAILHEKPYPIEKIRQTVVDSAITLIKNNASAMRGESCETLE